MIGTSVSGPAKTQRDVRLDFFRGLGMFIILIAHITNNPWTLYIPARFGFSDATEMFIFCSGMASAIAFGAVFKRAGFALGLLRVALRIWEIYWVHIATFMITLAAMFIINRTGLFARDEVGALNLVPFLKASGNQVIGLFTLTYVPNYFDILPMYIVILALLPVMVLMSRAHVYLACAFSLLLWFAATATNLNLPAEYWFSNNSTRQWFFNPFAWQLVFFTGFAFMSGWLQTPPRSRNLALACIAILLVSLPFAWHVTIAQSDLIKLLRKDWRILIDKTDFGVLRYVHFLALAYLAWLAAGVAGENLTRTPLMQNLTRIFSRVGQQSLAVFASSIVLARVLGAMLNELGSGFWASLFINVLGFFCIYGIANLVAFTKSEPWRGARHKTPILVDTPDEDTRATPKLVVVK
jgi:hypothetical protein